MQWHKHFPYNIKDTALQPYLKPWDPLTCSNSVIEESWFCETWYWVLCKDSRPWSSSSHWPRTRFWGVTGESHVTLCLKSLILSLTLYCCHLDVSIISDGNVLYFHFVLGPTNDAIFLLQATLSLNLPFMFFSERQIIQSQCVNWAERRSRNL